MNTTLYTIVNDTIKPDIVNSLFSHTAQIITCLILFIYIILGLIGNIFNICLFITPALFRTSCSLYLLSTSIGNLIVTIFVLPIRILADGFDQDLTNYSLFACKLVSYIYYICLALPPYFTVLACIDRWAASSIQVNRRGYANIRIVKRCIPACIILPFIFYSFIFFTFSRDPKPPPPYCSIDDSYAVFGLAYYLLIYSIIPPFLMGLFSFGIISNVLRRRAIITPANQLGNMSISGTINRPHRRRLTQMQIMLVCQAIIECILTLPFSIINLVSIVVVNDEYFLTIYSFIRLFIFFNYISSFYVYTLSSKLYRNELKKLIIRIFNRR